MASVLDEAGADRRWFAPVDPRSAERVPRFDGRSLVGTRFAEAPTTPGAPRTSAPGYLLALFGALGTRRGHRRLCRSNAVLAARNVASRLATAQAELDEAEAGYVFLAGDSHAELLGHPAWAGRTVVNGGIGGRSARHYAEDLPRLAFRRRASVAVLSVGTNDIMCRSKPLTQRAAALFDASVGTILEQLRAHADRVVVLAVPPIALSGTFPRDPRAVELYSWQILRTATQRDCAYFDPFAPIRTDDFGLARPDALSDEVHLADYGPVWERTLAFLRSDPSGAA